MNHPQALLLRRLPGVRCMLLLCCLAGAGRVRAQAGPPFLTNDPGTPGNANWEINLASLQTQSRGFASYQTPQIDLNFGVGERIQLTYQVPYVFDTASGAPAHSGWGNGYPGIKWRFLDQGEDGWQASIFPQVETAGTRLERTNGIAEAGPRYLLPAEIYRKVGPLDLDFEVGYYLFGHASKERIIGFAAGRSVTERLELDGEVYDDHADGAGPHFTTLDIGGRYKLRPGVIALFMIGRSVNGFSQGQPEYMSYLGVQLLLSDYGRRFTTEP
jgi:hypothetical protein